LVLPEDSEQQARRIDLRRSMQRCFIARKEDHAARLLRVPLEHVHSLLLPREKLSQERRLPRSALTVRGGTRPTNAAGARERRRRFPIWDRLTLVEEWPAAGAASIRQSIRAATESATAGRLARMLPPPRSRVGDKSRRQATNHRHPVCKSCRLSACR